MVDFKSLDEKYVIHYERGPDHMDFDGHEFVLLKKMRDTYDDRHISVSEAYTIAEQKNDVTFSAGQSLDLQCYIDTKTLNDQLGVESDFLTHYIVARITGRKEPFTKEKTRKKLNVLFGFEKYNPQDNLFLEKRTNEDGSTVIRFGADNCIGEFEFQRRNCAQLTSVIQDSKDNTHFVCICTGEKVVATCQLLEEGNGNYAVSNLEFATPERDLSKPFIELYQISAARCLVREILDYIVSSERFLKKAGLVGSVKMKQSSRPQKSDYDQNAIASINSGESLTKVMQAVQADETAEWFTQRDIHLQIDEFQNAQERTCINRLSRTKIQEAEDWTTYELRFETLPDVWTENETALIMPKYCINGSFHFPSYGPGSIAKGAFKNLNNLKFLYIPETVKNIEDGAFENCPELKSVMVEDGVEYRDSAFINCGGSKEFYAWTNLYYSFYHQLFYWDTGLPATIYIDVAGETEKRFGKLLMIVAFDSDRECIGIPFTVEENPKIAMGSDSDLENLKEYFESDLGDSAFAAEKEFIQKNLAVLKAVAQIPQKNGRPDFDKAKELFKNLVTVDGQYAMKEHSDALSQAEIDTLLDGLY